QYIANKESSGGSVEFDLAELVSMTEKVTAKEYTKLAKAPDKKSVLKFVCKTKWLKELKSGDKEDDTASVAEGMSTAGSVDHSRAEEVGGKTDGGGKDDDSDDDEKEIVPGSSAAISAAAAAAGATAASFAKSTPSATTAT